MAELILLKNIGLPDSHKLDTYVKSGGYQAARKALEKMIPAEVIAEVKASGLRGRGGAGFPTGMKWGFFDKKSGKKGYLCCNADESEPGTFKDRVIIEKDPHQFIEGAIIASYALEVHTAYIYIRGEYPEPAATLEQALKEAYQAGYLGRDIFGKGYDLDIFVQLGAGAYICGEETALLESLEGKRGWPRVRPPYPAVEGLFRAPTVVNNVETLCNVPHIINNGAAWYTKIGKEKNTGPKLYCVSGHVNKPGLYEFPMGVPLDQLIDTHCGGVKDKRKLKAVLPGGSSSNFLTGAEYRVDMDFDSLAKAGTMLGSAGVIVMDENTCIVDAALNLARFYAHESCGQCTPCREGTTWAMKILRRIEHGFGRAEDLGLLADIYDNMAAKTICPLADGAVLPLESSLRKFRKEYEEHIELGRCPLRHR